MLPIPFLTELPTRRCPHLAFFKDSVWHGASPPLPPPVGGKDRTPLPGHERPRRGLGNKAASRQLDWGEGGGGGGGDCCRCVQLFIMLERLAEIRKGDYTTFSLLLRQCPWPGDNLAGAKWGTGFPWQYLCGLRLYQIIEVSVWDQSGNSLVQYKRFEFGIFHFFFFFFGLYPIFKMQYQHLTDSKKCGWNYHEQLLFPQLLLFRRTTNGRYSQWFITTPTK